MNDKINIKRPDQILDYVDTKEHLVDLFNYINQLQSNWNSLREWLENEKIHCEGYFDWVLDKVNELEGTNHEKN